MAIAEGILDIALRYARENQSDKVSEVGLVLGELSGVESDSLFFCWESLTRNTIAEGALLKLRRTELRGRCTVCGLEIHIEGLNFVCPACGETLELVAGRELKVEYLEVD